jgi:hypothetical protein
MLRSTFSFTKKKPFWDRILDGLEMEFGQISHKIQTEQ